MANPDPATSLTTRTTANATINVLGALWGGVLGVIQVPIILRALGAGPYGIYVLITAVAAYLGLVELNLSSALVKYVAEYAGRNERAKIQEVIGTTIALYLGLATSAAVVFLLAGRALLPHLNIPADSIPIAWEALEITACALPFTFIAGTLGMVPAAIGRFDISVIVSVALGTVSTIGAVCAVLLGGRLVALTAVNALVSVLATVVSVMVGRRLFPGVSFRPRWIRARAAQLLRFSVFSLLSKLSGALVQTADRIAIGVALGPAAVAYYSVPASLLRRITGVTNRMSYVILPVASDLSGREDRSRLKRAYIRSARITWLVGAPAAIVLVVLAHPLLALWVGHEFADRGVWVMRAFAVAFAFDTAANVPALVTEGMGHPKVSGGFAAARAVVNLGLLIPAVLYLGVNGVGATYLLASAALVPPFLHYVQTRLVGLTWSETLRCIYVPTMDDVRMDVKDVWRALRGRLRLAPSSPAGREL